MKKIRCALTILFILMTFIGSSISALAADAEKVGQEDFDVISDDTVIEGDDESVSISIIGGADGPTSIFLAGKLGSGFRAAVTIGIVLLVAVITVIVLRVCKRKGHKNI